MDCGNSRIVKRDFWIYKDNIVDGEAAREELEIPSEDHQTRTITVYEIARKDSDSQQLRRLLCIIIVTTSIYLSNTQLLTLHRNRLTYISMMKLNTHDSLYLVGLLLSISTEYKKKVE